MSEQRVATRYAQALIDLSKEQNIVDVVLNDIKLFQQTLHSSTALQSMLKSPVIIGADKIAVLKKLFEKHFHKTTIAFFDIVVRKKRASVLSTISEAFVHQYNQLNNIILATVKTAQAIDEKTKAEITAFIEKESGKKAQIELIVDPSLIGGLIIQIEDRLYDASLSGKLNKVKQNLLNTYISK